MHTKKGDNDTPHGLTLIISNEKFDPSDLHSHYYLIAPAPHFLFI